MPMGHLWRVAVLLYAAAAVGTAAAPAAAPRGTAGGAGVPRVTVSAAGLLPSGSEARFYDWTRAGYRAGKQDFPKEVGAGTFDVTASGAKSDGSKYADSAVKAALEKALKAGGVVYFPKGTYKLSKPLFANASNVVFRGAGQSKTKLVFPQSLTDAYNTNSYPDECTGEDKNLWSAGGGFFTFDGTAKLKAAPPKELARVPSNKEVKSGDTKLPVTSTSKFWVGQWVVLVIDDTSTAPDTEGECENRLNSTQRLAASAVRALPSLPTWVRRDPLFQLAVNTAQAVADEDRRGASGLVQAGPGAASSVAVAPAMADKGTIAAWVYGENSVDSGGPGAINPGAMRFVFQVKKKGDGYIVPDRPLILAVKPGWTAVIQEYKSGIETVGVQDLTITFKDSGKYKGHFSDRGYNAIFMVNLRNGFVRNVRIENADNAIMLRRVDFSTFSDIVVTTGNRTWTDGKNMNGHNGISLSIGQSNLVTRFDVKQRYYHDISVGTSATLNVFSNGGGVDVNVEHHRAGPMANLFSNINVGKNTRPWYSGGREDRGAHTGRGGTYWNVRAGSGAANQKVILPDCDFGPLLTFVLPKRSGSTCSSKGWKVSTWTSSKPADLHKAQLDALKK